MNNGQGDKSMRNRLFIAVIAMTLYGCATPIKQNPMISTIEVDGEQWQAVTSFRDSSPNDRHYVVRLDEDGSTIIRFGDGINGARLPTETSQIRIRYQHGGGRHYTGVRQQQGRVWDSDCR